MNRARGEVRARVGGAERRLCLTLGTLAELETAFGTDGLEALSAKLQRLSAGDLATVLAALLRGGGETDAERAAASASLEDATTAIAAAFRAALG